MNDAKPEGAFKRVWRTLRDNALAVVVGGALVVAAIVVLTFSTDLLASLDDAKSNFRSAWRDRKTDGTRVVLAVFPDSTVSSPMVRALGFTGNVRSVSLSANPNVDLIRFDEEATWEATRAALLRRLSESPEVVLIIGHERSSTVKELLPTVYRNSRHGHIPLILPAVTNPDLTKISGPDDLHVLRLPATDDKQVETLRILVDRLPGDSKAVMLLGDNGNREYSSYIVRELLSRGLSLPIVDVQGVDLFSAGFSPERFLVAKPTSLIFAGMELEAILLTRRLKAAGKGLGGDDFALVLTDGAAGEYLQQALGSVLGPMDFVYLTGPFPAPVAKGAATEFPTYAPYASAAKMLAANLIERASLAGAVSRRSVLRALQQMAAEDVVLNSDGLSISFDANGDNRHGTYHIYELYRASVRHSCLCTCRLPGRECGDE